ncbi:MAG: IPT/TIG domain-containing protein, partial [Actinomycetota bacterium]|nr:IPT/TIG domain-containing protein [Actinomycetota bacterium]
MTRWVVAGLVAAGMASGATAAVLALGGGSAAASGPTVCTWTAAAAGSGTAYWSVAGNWNCGSGTGNGPPATADAVVFPATIPSAATAATPSLDISTPILASITFENSYTLGITSTSTTISLDPGADGVSGNVAISDTSASATPSIGTPGSPEGTISITGDATVESAGGLLLNAALSGGSSTDTLTFGTTSSSTYIGSVAIEEPATYADTSTVVASGNLYNKANNALPTTTSLEVTGGYDLAGYSQTLAGLTGTLGDVFSNTGAPTLTVDSSGSDTYGGSLRNGLALADAGAGPLTLDGTSTYTGATTVASGAELVLSSSGALGSTSGVTVDSGGSLAIDNAGTPLSFSSPLTLGSGVSGAASLLDTGTTGGDTWAGTVALTSGSSYVVANQSSLPGSTFTLSGTITPGSSAGTLVVDVSTSGGSVELSGTNADFPGGILVNSGTLVGASADAFGPGTSGCLNFSTGACTVTASGTNASVELSSGSGGITIPAGIGAELAGGSTLDGLGATGKTDTWSGPIELGCSGCGASANLESSGGALDLPGVISTASGATSGTLVTTAFSGPGIVLSGSNTYTSAVEVAGGTLIANSAGALSSATPTVTVDTRTTLDLGASGTFANHITGGGSLVSDPGSGGTVTLSSTNTYTGTTTLSSGTLDITNGGALGGAGGGTVTVDSGATLEPYSSGITLPNDISAAGGSTIAAGSPCGTTTGCTIAGSLSLTGAVSIDAQTDTNFYFTGKVSGTGSITTDGPYTTHLENSSNSYSGGTTVATGGTLVVSASGALGTGTVTDLGNGPIVLRPGVTESNQLDISGSSYCGGELCSSGSGPGISYWGGPITLEGATSLAAGSGDELVVTGNISGNYGLTTAGSGQVLLSGANSYTGGTAVTGNMLEVASSGALGGTPGTPGSGGAVSVDAGSTLQLASGSSNPACLPPGMAAPSSFSLPNDVVLNGTGLNGHEVIDNCEGTNTISGNVILQGSTVPIDVNCTSSLTACQSTDSLTLSGVVSDSGGSYGLELGNGSGGVNGQLTLSGTNTYTGTTTVTTGTLDVTGSITSSSGVTLYGGNVLEGTGSVPAITTSGCSTSPCTIYPGDAPGTLTSTGYANLSASGSTLQVSLAGTSAGTYSQLVADGADISGTNLDLTTVTPGYYGARFDILHNTSSSALTGELSYQGSPLSEGEVFSAGGQKLQITYTGSPTGGAGTGHDVVLTNVTNPPAAPATPVVSSVSPTSGPPAGGTSVTITGSNLLDTALVDFGSTPAESFDVVSASQIDAISPAGSTGNSVNVTVTTPGGSSATSSSDLFTYVAAIPPGFHPITPTRICDTRDANPSGLSGTALTNCEGKAPGTG